MLFTCSSFFLWKIHVTYNMCTFVYPKKIFSLSALIAWKIHIIYNMYVLGPIRTWRHRCIFSCRHMRTVTLVTIQAISDDIMLITSKICVVVVKCEQVLSFSLSQNILLSALIASNDMSWPGGATISFYT